MPMNLSDPKPDDLVPPRTPNYQTSIMDETELPFALPLEIQVTDQELVQELLAYAEGPAREQYALCALKIGLIALKQARGQLDGDMIKREGEKLLSTLEGKLSLHARSLNDQLSGA